MVHRTTVAPNESSVIKELNVPDLVEGDIYRWSYRDRKIDYATIGGTYHCCSRIAVVKNGLLQDTFWSSPGSDGRSFSAADLPRLDLTFIANFSDLEKAQEYDADYYDDSDIVNLNHSNSSRGNFYLRKGAKRSQAKMLATAREKLEISIGDERRAADKSERLRQSIARIEAGDIETYI